MDVPQLKLLAGRVRALLSQSSSEIGHSQSLDLIAALPGLRSWPEVIAFPQRVAACEVDAGSAGRLAFRLKKNFGLQLSPNDVLSALLPSNVDSAQLPLQVWPGGPPFGVYVTTSAAAITALLTRYEEATDGGLVYAERAANGWEGSIDLGEHGLWSAGIDRLPSGTLLVVGPLELDQQSWNDATERVQMACLHALKSGHRVAILIDTPTPQMLYEDLVVLVRSAASEPSDIDTALVGAVSESGELEIRRPFAKSYPKPVQTHANVGLDALPDSTREILRHALAAQRSGIVLFGASQIAEHTAYEQLAAGLALSEHAGPAARIMPRHRGTPAKDWLVPEAIKALPFLPSIESAYAQGYRRMIITPNYSRSAALADYDDVLFLGGTWGNNSTDIALRVLVDGYREEVKVAQKIVAILCLLRVASRRGQVVASDLFVRGTSTVPIGTNYDEFKAFLKANRPIRWEDELTTLLDTGAVTVSGVRKAAERNHEVLEFLAQRRTVKKAS